MKLYTVGPVEMYQSTLDIRGRQIPYFRTDEFSKMMVDTDKTLQRLLNAPEGNKTVYLTASGTAAMEASIMNCFDENDKILVINGGSFGERFAKICGIHGIDYTQVIVPFEENLSYEILQPYENSGYTGMVVNINETSLGKLYDIELIAEFCRNNNLYLVVDGIGSVFADEISISKYGIDALIFSSQKALALSPGISVIMLSDRIITEKTNNINVKSLYFDFKDYLLNFERGQTPYTPAVGTCHELAGMIQKINKEGMSRIISEKNEKALYFREKVQKAGFEIPKYNLSNALTPILFDGYAYDLYVFLKNEYDLVVTPNGGEYRNKLIRVGHMGNLRYEDFDELIEKMEIARERLR